MFNSTDKIIKQMNIHCEPCPASLLCMLGTVQEIQKCGNCGRIEARWGDPVGKDVYWESEGSIYVTYRCPRRGLQPACALSNLEPWCSECNARYANE